MSSVSSALSGHIEALELVNFKSYAGEHYIGPFRDFTCIIGPNGSGKSNVMDSISFVLGIKTASLRATHLKDLVCSAAGLQQRPNKAIVRLHFVSGRKKVVFERSVTATGTSQYLVDAKLMTWAKYEAVLKSFNILASTRNCLIFQGEVEQMAHKNPRDITQMIELVAGSADLKLQYEDKKKALAVASEKVRNAGLLKRGAGVERGIMEGHKKEAELYHSLMHDMTTLKVEQSLIQFYHIETALLKIKKFQNIAQKDVSEKEKALKAIEADFTAAKSVTNDLYKNVHKMTREERAAQHDVNSQRKVVQDVEVRCRTLEGEVKRVQAQSAKADEEKKASNQRTEQLRSDLNEQKQILSAHETTWAAEDANMDQLSEADYKEFRTLREQAQAQTVGYTNDVKVQTREVEHIRHQLTSLQEVRADQVRREQSAQEKVVHIIAREEEITNQGEETPQEKEWNDELKTTKNQHQTLQQDLSTKEERLKVLTESIASMRTQREESRSSQKMEAALSDMKELYNGLHGRLYSLIKIPNARHRVAVTVALGKHMDAVVTDTDRTAHDCVQYLKDQRVGTMNFIPLNSVRGKDVTDAHRVLGGTAKPVVNCIQYPPWLAPAIKYAIGQTIMVDETEEGQKVAWEMQTRHKVVTLDGTVMQKNGVMTGGAASIEERARKFDQKDLEAKKQERDRLAQTVRSLHMDTLKLQEKERDLTQQVQSEQQRRHIAKADLARWAEKKSLAEKELSTLKRDWKDLSKRITDKEKEYDQANTKAQQSRDVLREKESVIFGDFAKRVHIKDIHDFESSMLTKDRDRASKTSAIRSLMVKLQAQIDYEEKSDKALSPQQLKEAKKKVEKELAAAKEDHQAKKKVLDTKEKALQKTKKELDTTNGTLRKEDDTVAKCKRDLNAALAKCEEVRKKPQALLTVRDRLRAQRAGLYTRCIADDVKLPTVSLDNPAEVGKKRARKSTGHKSAKKGARPDADDAEDDEKVDEPLDRETTVDEKGFITVSEIFESGTDSGAVGRKGKKTTSDVGKQAAQQLLGIDFASLPKKLREAVRDNKDNKAQKYREELALLDHKIEKKSDEITKLAPNLKAEKNFKGMSSKLRETAEEFADAEKEEKKRKLEFIQVKEERGARFQKAFTIIEKEVAQIYRMLTQGTRGQAACGAAYIHCEEMHEQYLGGTKYTACPPNKEFREMDQLSGGEKTVAALALLFAIHKVCPSPFFVLDEVDAALDQKNVDKVISYVQQSRQHCQFLVISLKSCFYETASSLVGVHKNRGASSSGVLTLDLTQYDEA